MTAVDTQGIAHLDFTPTLPCEHPQHPEKHPDEPAAWLVTTPGCPCCPYIPARAAVCDWVRKSWITRGVTCRECRVSSPFDQWGMTFTPLDGAR